MREGKSERMMRKKRRGREDAFDRKCGPSDVDFFSFSLWFNKELTLW
jgi:hypothetical protein